MNNVCMYICALYIHSNTYINLFKIEARLTIIRESSNSKQHDKEYENKDQQQIQKCQYV